MTDLTIDGETFRVEVEGDPDRPTVLLSCSLGTDLSLFDAQMPALLEHFQVVRYDPRGHGGSTLAGAPYGLARLGADALAVLDALGIEQAHVVGVSMGGMVAQWLLVNAPERIGRAVLANTSARIGTPEVWNTRIATVLADGTGGLAPATMERWFGAEFRAASADRVAAIESQFRATSAQGYAGCCAALRDADLRTAIRAVDRPVLVLSGRDDPVTSETDIAAVTDAIAGARHVVLDARHISNIEAEVAFNGAVIAFLTAKAPATRARAGRKAAVPARRRAGATTARKPLVRPAAPARRTLAAAHAAKAPARKAKPTTAKPATAKPATAKHATAKHATAKTPAKATTKTRAATKKTAPKRASPARAGVAKKTSARTPIAKSTVAKKPVAKKAVVKKAAKKTTLKKPTARRRPTKTPARPGRRRT